MFSCPRCRKPLARTQTRHGLFFVCPQCQGRAVGLAVVRKILLDHGGDVTVSSRPGEGATFTLELPMSSPAADRNLAGS